MSAAADGLDDIMWHLSHAEALLGVLDEVSGSSPANTKFNALANAVRARLEQARTCANGIYPRGEVAPVVDLPTKRKAGAR